MQSLHEPFLSVVESPTSSHPHEVVDDNMRYSNGDHFPMAYQSTREAGSRSGFLHHLRNHYLQMMDEDDDSEVST